MRRSPGFWLLLVSVWTMSAAAAAIPVQNDGKAVELPDGDGKAILQRACTTCHGLDEVVKFREYYTKDDWRDIVGTMVKYGAELKDGEAEILVEYLGKHFSRKSGQDGREGLDGREDTRFSDPALPAPPAYPALTVGRR